MRGTVPYVRPRRRLTTPAGDCHGVCSAPDILARAGRKLTRPVLSTPPHFLAISSCWCSRPSNFFRCASHGHRGGRPTRGFVDKTFASPWAIFTYTSVSAQVRSRNRKGIKKITVFSSLCAGAFFGTTYYLLPLHLVCQDSSHEGPLVDRSADSCIAHW